MIEKRFRALSLDDDPVTRKIMASALKKMGIECQTVSDSREFLRLVKEDPREIYFVDLDVEEKGIGFLIIEAIRKCLGEMPVVFIASGRGDHQSLMRGVEIGADDFLLKPFDFQIMTNKVSSFLETPEIRDWATGLNDVSSDRCQADALIDVELQDANEETVTILSDHLLLKGTVVELLCDTAVGNLVDHHEMEVRVERCEIDSKTQKFLVHGRIWKSGA